jgi:phospholipase D1/2
MDLTVAPRGIQTDESAAAGTPRRLLLLRARHLFALAAALIALLLAWEYLPLAAWLSPDRIGPALHRVSSSAWGGPAVVLAFVVGSLLILPITVLITATAIAFGPWSGFLWALLGSVLGAAANFGVGRLIGKRLQSGIAGERIRAVSARLARGGIVPVLVIRNLPVAPFAVVSLAAGASPIRLSDFLIGTALGVGPGIAALTVLGDRLRGVWQHPNAVNVSLLIGAIVLWIGLALGLQWAMNRFARRRARLEVGAQPG